MPLTTRSRRLLIATAILSALVALYALAGFLLVPKLARSAAQDYVEHTLHSQIKLGELHFNPFTFDLRISDLALTEADGAPLVAFRLFHLNAEFWASLWQRGAVLQTVELDQPDIAVRIARDGRINLQQLAPPPSTPPPAPQAKTALPHVVIGTLRIDGGRLSLEDQSRPKPFSLAVTPIQLTLNDFRTDAGAENPYGFSAATTAGERLEWSGDFSVQPLGSTGRFALHDLRLQTVDAYLQNQLPLKLADGNLSLDGDYRLNLEPQLDVQVHIPTLQLKQLALNSRQATTAAPVAVREIALKTLALSLAQRSITIDSVTVDGLKVAAQREADGSLSLSKLLSPTPATKSAAPAKPAGSSDQQEKPWQVQLAQLRLTQGAVDFEDRSTQPAARFALSPIEATVGGIRSDLTTPLAVQFDAGLNRRGHLHVEGPVQLQPVKTTLDLALTQFGLTDVQPYLNPVTTLMLRKGQLGVKGKLTATLPTGKPPQLRFAGDVQVDDLQAREAGASDDLLQWQSLQLGGIDFRQSPDQLHIARIDLHAPSARVEISPQGQINLAQLGKPAPTRAATPATSKAAAPPAKPPMPIEIQAIRIDGGKARFSDFSIDPHFSAAIQGLQGAVTGISSAPGSRAQIDLKGSVGPFAPVSVKGQANLLAATQFTDIALQFRNMELSTFNPYSGRFAGYNITKGKLTTELKYHIVDRRLEAEHHVVIDQLEFGDATGSKEAVPLPIKLAVALLKDRHGVIDLQLPVRGSLDDPSFRIGPVIWHVFTNLLSKAVTAPFSLLGSLFGGGEELSYLDFAPGVTTLSASEAGKLATLGKALVERPQLKLNVPITANATLDDPALARTALDHLAPPAATPKASDHLHALEALYRSQLQAAPDYPPLTDAERNSPDGATHAHIAVLEQALLKKLAPDDAALRQLGQHRAEAVQAAVLANPDIAPERIFVIVGPAAAATDQGNVRMALKLE